MLIGLLARIVNDSSHTKCASLNNQQWIKKNKRIKNIKKNKYYASLNVSLTVENVTEIVNGITINFIVSVKT